jgi:hypothetical protein
MTLWNHSKKWAHFAHLSYLRWMSGLKICWKCKANKWKYLRFALQLITSVHNWWKSSVKNGQKSCISASVQMSVCLGKCYDIKSDFFKKSRHFNNLKNLHIHVGQFTEEEKYALRMRKIHIDEYNWSNRYRSLSKTFFE